MTPSEINRRIEKLCGWTAIEDNKALMLGVPVWIGYPPTGAVIGRKKPIPDYYNDLNACCSFERPMSFRDQNLYAWTIRNLNPGGMDDFQIITATPEQHCEAFLRMHNQWSDAP